jgi:hypothetical protein
VLVVFDLKNTLSGGHYSLGVALGGRDGRRIDVIHDVSMFEVLPTPRILTDCVVNMFPEVSAASMVSANEENAGAKTSTKRIPADT